MATKKKAYVAIYNEGGCLEVELIPPNTVISNYVEEFFEEDDDIDQIFVSEISNPIMYVKELKSVVKRFGEVSVEEMIKATREE